MDIDGFQADSQPDQTLDIDLPIKKDDIVGDSLEGEYRERWKKLVSYLNTIYHKPDVEALKVIYASVAAHGQYIPSYLKDKPVWLFIVGVSGSGKTEIAIEPLLSLAGTLRVSDISKNAFLSGFGENGNGVLPLLTEKNKGNGILCFPDFTTILNKRWEDISEIVGQMRQMHDGRMDREIGNKRKPLQWRGKVTCLAAATNQLEESWGKFRDFGERFLVIRWRFPEDEWEEMGRKVLQMMGKRAEIHDNVRKLLKDFIDPKNLSPIAFTEADWESHGLMALSRVVALTRVSIIRDHSKRVVSIGDTEGHPRVLDNLASIAKGWATLMRRSYINHEDLALSRRLALDSVPRMRGMILRYLLPRFLGPVITTDMRQELGVPKSSFYRTLEDLHLLNIIEWNKESKQVGLEESFCDLLSKAQFL